MSAANLDPPKRVKGRHSQPLTNETGHHQEADTTEPSNQVCSESIAAQLHRRREAAYRLPPLPSGKRDPWGASR